LTAVVQSSSDLLEIIRSVSLRCGTIKL